MLLLKHRIKGFSFEYLLRFLSIIDMPTEIQSDCETYDQPIDIDCGTIIHEKWKLSAVYT